ncbi:HXXEE domain-containing protein [Streptococcus sp. HMSC068F04]|uniref:HXXEE domain-containing protein n=1 Tax=Streptococcus sp. HMSC068F04 TaxID=1715051 RepID=UPI00210ACB8D|nr:HXXEE domain-containing protein [Streptococcus sp. HMSC068F04]
MLFNYCLLPILFILHDFEEMIFIPLWKNTKKYQKYCQKYNFFGNVTNGSAFSVGVLEEFLILLMISLICEKYGNSELYFGFCVAYTYHFVIHIKMCLQIKGYVPGIYTSILQIPLMLAIIHHFWKSELSLLLYTLIAMFLVYSNLHFMHKVMPIIQNFFSKKFDTD